MKNGTGTFFHQTDKRPKNGTGTFSIATANGTGTFCLTLVPYSFPFTANVRSCFVAGTLTV